MTINSEQVLQQFLQFAQSNGVEGNSLYGATVSNFNTNSLTQPVFLDMMRYCQNMCSHFKQEPSFYPRTFLFFRDKQEYFIEFKNNSASNLFDVNNNELSETHETPFFHQIKDDWNGKKAIFFNLVLLLYLCKYKANKLLEVPSEMVPFYNIKVPEIDDVTDVLDGLFYRDEDEMSDAIVSIYGHNSLYRPYVLKLLREPDFVALKTNILVFARSLAPMRLPRVVAPKNSVWHVYPTCKVQRVKDGTTTLWGNMFQEEKECNRYTSLPKVQLQTPMVLLKQSYNALNHYFDGFEVENLEMPASPHFFNTLSDTRNCIVSVFHVTQNDNLFTFTFDTYRGSSTENVVEKQEVAPQFFLYQNGTLTFLLPKEKITETLLLNWNNRTVDVNGFPVLSISKELLEQASQQYCFLKSDPEKTRQEFLLNWYFGRFVGFAYTRNHFDFKPNFKNQDYNEFIQNVLWTPFLPWNFLTTRKNRNNETTLGASLPFLNLMLRDKFNSGLTVFQGFFDSLYQTPLNDGSWKFVFQEVSNSTERFVCVFYGRNFVQHEFIVFAPETATDVKQASLYFHLHIEENNQYLVHTLMPMYPTLSKHIIEEWKRGPQSPGQENAESLYQLVLSCKNELQEEKNVFYTKDNLPSVAVHPSTVDVGKRKALQFMYATRSTYLSFDSKSVRLTEPYSRQLNLENLELLQYNYELQNPVSDDQKEKLTQIFGNNFEMFEWSHNKLQWSLSHFELLDRFLCLLTNDEKEKYWIRLFTHRYRKSNIQLYFKLVAKLLQRSIFLMIELQKNYDNDEDQPDEVRPVLRYFHGSNEKGALFFYISKVLSFEDDINDSKLLDESSDKIVFLYPVQEQLSSDIFSRFYDIAKP
jgi:hypothetical protein